MFSSGTAIATAVANAAQSATEQRRLISQFREVPTPTVQRRRFRRPLSRISDPPLPATPSRGSGVSPHCASFDARIVCAERG